MTQNKKSPIKLLDPKDCKVKCGSRRIRRTIPWSMRKILEQIQKD